MVDKKTIYASLIDLAGTVLLVGFLFISPAIGFVLQLACYFVTYRYFKEKFWKAFAFSVAFLIVLFIVGIMLFTYTQLGSMLVNKMLGF